MKWKAIDQMNSDSTTIEKVEYVLFYIKGLNVVINSFDVRNPILTLICEVFYLSTRGRSRSGFNCRS